MRTSLLVLALTLACAGAAKADSFQNGQFVTYVQNDWGNGGAAAGLLQVNYPTVFASTFGIVTVGLPNTGFTMRFDGSGAVLGYLPTAGAPGTLAQNLLDPTSTSAGIFGGDVLALQLNLDFNNAGFLKGTSNILFGNLVLTNLGSSLSALNGLTVNQFLADANTCLGGGLCIDSVASLDDVAANLNFSFSGGVVSTFAGTNLALPTSATVPEPSSLLLVATGLLGLGWTRRFKRAR